MTETKYVYCITRRDRDRYGDPIPGEVAFIFDTYELATQTIEDMRIQYIYYIARRPILKVIGTRDTKER